MKVAIIGAGACGLAVANVLCKTKIEYVVFERNKKPGSKILASGNGRCNIANDKVIDKKIKINYQLLYDFLAVNECPLVMDDEGRYYPLTNTSETVLNVFLKALKPYTLRLNCPVSTIKKQNNQYLIGDEAFDKLVLCSGSGAGIISTKRNVVYDYLTSLNIQLTTLKPSLVGFKVKENISSLKGLRISARATLYNNQKVIYTEDGEVQFKEDGLSGIVIMNLSYYYNQLKYYKNPQIKLVLNPNFDYNHLKSLEYALPRPLFDYLAKNNLKPDNLKFSILSTYDQSMAQVIAGGIPLAAINPDFSLKQDPNIYCGGELLDLDYPCGGYNISTAFATGFMIGENIKDSYEICNRIKDASR